MISLVTDKFEKFRRRWKLGAAKHSFFNQKSSFIVLSALIAFIWISPVSVIAQEKKTLYERMNSKNSNQQSKLVFGSEYEAEDLIGSGPTCKSKKDNYPEIGNCGLRKSSIEPIRDLQITLIRNEGTRFAQDLKKDYFSKIRSSLVSQYAAATWLGKANPLDGKDSRYLKKAIESASQKCDGESTNQFRDIKSEIEKIDPLAELGLKKIPQDHLEKSRDFFLKRMLIAWVDLNRIERFLTDRPIGKEEKQKLRERQRKIRETYPLVASSNDAYSLRQLAKVYYGQIFDQDSTKSHPQIDQILFPDDKNSYSLIEPGKQIRQGNEAMINLILQSPINPKVEAEIQSLMTSSISKSFESVGAFCELNPCQTMQLDLNTTAKKMNQLPQGNSVVSKAACSCNLMTPTEYVGSGKQLLMAGAAIGGLVLCPFTFGIGCYGSAAAGAALALSSAANTYGAIKDHNQMEPLVRTVMSLPGLSEDERKKILTDDNEVTGRVLGGVAGTALGGVPGPALLRRGTNILTSAEAFRPIAKATVNGEKLLKSTSSQIEELNKMGVKFKKDTGGITSVEGDVKWWPDNVKYSKGNLPEEHYGDILKVTQLPPPSQGAGLMSNAFKHPEMAEYLKKMDEMGIDLVVDTSLRGTGTGAYYWGRTNVIALRPDSSWQTFLHEFQHAQFDAFIRPKMGMLKDAVQVEGRSIKDVLPRNVVNEYGEKEIARLEKLLRQGHTERGINETMSTSRELDALGWKQYIPGVGSPRSYGATHRVNSLAELKESGVSLTETQSKSLMKGRAEVILSYAYDIGGAVGGIAATPIVVIKSASGAFELYRNINMIYNQKTGDVIVQTPDGRTIRTSYEKNPNSNGK